MILTLQPVGQVAPSVLERLRGQLRQFGDVRIANPKPVPKQPFGRLPKPVRAAAFEGLCRSPGADRVVAITDVELSDPELGMKRVFGHAGIAGGWAVVSLSMFGGDGEERLVERTAKTAVHEIGHTLGLGHHDGNPDCVMYFSETLADTDRKGRDFCPACAETANLTLSRLEK
ncbi:MAG TPA: zinc-dependent metalloprotease family protein [Thermoplasmata archaeon]